MNYGRTLHTVLKNETAALHRQLDAQPALRALLKNTLRATEYRQILQLYAQAYHPIELPLRALEQDLPLGHLPPYQPRLPSILHDLSCLAGNPPLTQPPVEAPSALIEVHGMADYLGLRYVLEGATQGGRYLAKCLKKHGPPLPENAFSFWEVQLTVSEQWPLFCQYLDRPALGAVYERQMINAARSAFCSFIECFSFFEEDP